MRAIYALLLLVLLAACATEPETAPISADQQFEELLEEFLNGLFYFRPVFASRLGIHDYDSLLPDYSPRAVAAEVERVDYFLERISALPAGDLSLEHRQHLKSMKTAMEAWRFNLTMKPDFKRDPLFYNDLIVQGLELLLRRDHAPAAVRMDALNARLRRIPYLLEVARINLTEVPEILRTSSGESLVNSMYMLRDHLPGRIGEQMDGRLPEGFEEAHLQAVYAYMDYIIFVRGPLGYDTLEEHALGEPHFLQRWKNEESVELSIDATLELCRSTREILLERMKQVARLIDGEASIESLLQGIEDDTTTVKWVTDAAAEAAVELKIFVEENDLLSFPAGGDADLRILAPDPRSFDTVTSLPPGLIGDTNATGYVSINPISPTCRRENERLASLRFFTPYSIALYTAGATYPGRFLQTLKAQNASPMILKVLEPATLIDGWSHYTEELVMETGFDARPEALLTQLRLSLMEVNRLEISTRIHCQGMSIKEAVEFLASSSFICPCMAQREVIQIIRNPKAGAAFIGKAQILKLRNSYLAEDEHRSLKSFHDRLLDAGRLPVSVIARRSFGKSI